MRCSASKTLSSSPLFSASTANEITPTGTGGAATRTRCLSSLHSVSPVRVSFSLGTAAIWPGPTSLVSVVDSPEMRRIFEMRSLVPVRAFTIIMSVCSVPEITRTTESMPA